jgi:hypothetical protein
MWKETIVVMIEVLGQRFPWLTYNTYGNLFPSQDLNAGVSSARQAFSLLSIPIFYFSYSYVFINPVEL